METCAGIWRKLELVGGHLPQLENQPPQAAYMVEGSFLWIDLLAGWCDVEDQIVGNIEGRKFTGKRQQGGMLGREVAGTVRAWRTK